MPRSVNHVASRAKRKRILKLTRGYYGARKNVWTVAKNTWEKGLTYAFATVVTRNVISVLCGFSVSTLPLVWKVCLTRLMGALHAAGIEINRKVLADLAVNHPEAFKAIVAKVK